MRARLLAAVALLFSAFPAAAQTALYRADWERAWRDLAALDAGELSERERRAARAGLERLRDEAARVAAVQRDEALRFRARLVGWHLERLAGRRPPRLVPTPDPIAWYEGEAWAAARALRPCAPRTAAFVELLARGGAPEPALRAQAESASREDASQLRFGDALAVAEALDARYGDAASLAARADALRQLARAPDAERLCRERLEQNTAQHTAQHADLAEEALVHVALARALLARGDEPGARRELGAALALGSAEGALVLCGMEFACGEHARVLRLAAGVPETAAARSRALQWWGLGLVSRARAPQPVPEPLR